nr:MAG TPA: hypothetical protein [Caudoviricetes sp.]
MTDLTNQSNSRLGRVRPCVRAKAAPALVTRG